MHKGLIKFVSINTIIHNHQIKIYCFLPVTALNLLVEY